MFHLFKTKKVMTKELGYVAFRKTKFGSSYPNLTKEEEIEMKALFPNTQRINKLGNIDHPNIYYKALYLSKIIDGKK